MSAKPSGLAHVRKGFCFDAEHDELFALGWPHLRRVYDEEDLDVPRVAAQALMAADFDLSIDWPRRVAAALTHVWGGGDLYDFTPSQRYFRKAAKDALTRSSDPTPEEVHVYLGERLRRSPLWASERATRSFVLLLEALTSTEIVVDGILDELEAMDPDALVSWATQPAWVTFQLGYLLLRLDSRAATKARKRMEALVQTAAAWGDAVDAPPDSPSHLRSLRLVLEPLVTAQRDTDRELRWYSHAVDAGDLIADRVRRHPGGALPDVRLAWLGGADLMAERTFRRWPRLDVRGRKWFQTCIAPIQHERTAIYMADMLGRPDLEMKAKTWLRLHRDLSVEALTPLKGHHEKARRALEFLS